MLIRQYYLILILLAMLGCTSQKEKEPLSDQASQVTMVGDVEKGKKLYSSCIPCHGPAGEGDETLKMPALANSDSWYLYRQLMNFKSGTRGSSPNDSSGYQMATMVNILKDSVDISDVVAYINSLPVVPIPVLIAGDVKKGKRTYETICGSCHGPAARGNEKMNAPNLNGLDDRYIKRQVNKFKSGLRGSHPQDILGAQMIPMMALLTSDQAVDDVIAYIRSTAQANTQ